MLFCKLSAVCFPNLKLKLISLFTEIKINICNILIKSTVPIQDVSQLATNFDDNVDCKAE